MENAPDLSRGTIKHFPDKVLFFIFYNMHHERAQVDAAKDLENRGWSYDEETMTWYKKVAKSTNTIVFDPVHWTEKVIQ